MGKGNTNFPPFLINFSSCFITSDRKDHMNTKRYLGFIFLILFLEIIFIKLPGVYFPIFFGLASQVYGIFLLLKPQ